MAASSITENICVNDPKLLEEYAEMLDKSDSHPFGDYDYPDTEEITDVDEIRQLLLNGIQKWSKGDL